MGNLAKNYNLLININQEIIFSTSLKKNEFLINYPNLKYFSLDNFRKQLDSSYKSFRKKIRKPICI